MQPEAAGSFDTAANRIVDTPPNAKLKENASGRQRLVIRVAYKPDDLRHPTPIPELPEWLRAMSLSRRFRLIALPLGLGSALLMVLWLNTGRIATGQPEVDSHRLSRSESATGAQSAPMSMSRSMSPAASHSPNDRGAAASSADTVPAAAAQIEDKPHRSATPTVTTVAPANAPAQSDMLQALSEKRDLLHSVRLSHFDWHPDDRNSVLLLDLKIRNTGSRRIERIELICTQYSKDLTLLETAKIPLQGAVDPVAQRSFKSLVGGLMNPATRRVQCLISDASAASVPK